MYFRFLFLCIVFFTNLHALKDKNVGYLNEIYNDLKYKNSDSVLKIWIKDLTKNIGINANLIAYSNYSELLNDYLEEKIDILVINPYFYLIDSQKLDKNTIIYWNLQQNKNSNLEEIYLIVNKNSNIKKISDLNNKKIVLRKNNYFGKMFLEKLYLEKNKKNSKKFMSNLNYVNSNTFLINTYFGDYDASIIDSYYFRIMYELNPSIMQRLEILVKSPKIFNNHMILFSNKNTKEELEIYESRLNYFLNSLKRNDLFDLLKINAVSIFYPSDIKELKSYYKEYSQLVKKYNEP